MTCTRLQRRRRGIELTLPDECHARLEELEEVLGETRSRIVERMILEWEPPEKEIL